MIDTVIRWEVWSFLAAAAGIVGWQALTGRLNTNGLLRTRPGGPLSPTRVQLVFTTMGFAGWYLTQSQLAPAGAGLPDVPNAALLALAGSHATYLTGKSLTLLNWQQYLRRT